MTNWLSYYIECRQKWGGQISINMRKYKFSSSWLHGELPRYARKWKLKCWSLNCKVRMLGAPSWFSVWLFFTLSTLIPINRVTSSLSLTDTEKPGKTAKKTWYLFLKTFFLCAIELKLNYAFSASVTRKRSPRDNGSITLRRPVSIRMGRCLSHPLVQRQCHQTHV